MELTRSCVICFKQFSKPITCSTTNWKKRQYCSKACANSRVRERGNSPVERIEHGLNGYNKHACRCDICREAIRLRKRQQRTGILVPREQWGHKEDKNPAWKGDDVSYKNIHEWVKRHKQKAGICSHCGVNRGIDKSHATQWANIDHEYRRALDDYIELCPSCHKKYDLRYNRGKRVML